MWYLLSEKNGLIDETITKNEMVQKHGKAFRSGIILDKCYYKIEKENEELILVSTEEQAIELGFDKNVFKKNSFKKKELKKEQEQKEEKIKKTAKIEYKSSKKTFELRDYQKAQIRFIEDRINIADTISIQSPTGSGKSVTMLQFVKDWLSKSENQLSNVVISTGFNNLVFDMEERCRQFGLTPRVLIGTRACNCPALMSDEDVANMKVFSRTDEYRCGDQHKHLDDSTDKWNEKTCPFTRELYKQYMSEIINNVGQVIITNHSSLLIHQENLQNCSLLIIDEAHTFANFYESYLRLELDENDLKQIDEAINSLKPPMNMIVKMNIQKGVTLPSQQIDAICDNIKNSKTRENTRTFFETKPNISNYIERNKNSYTIDHFYRSFNLDMNCKKILFSATLDAFTLNMFRVRKSNVYREYKMFCDYSKSELLLVNQDDFNIALHDFLEYVNEKGLKYGLILSTTIFNMKQAIEQDGIYGYKMFDDITEFEKFKYKNSNEKAILVGSRALFQGIDIYDLDFVCLDKLPFPVYNEKLQAQQRYLESGNDDFSSWNDFTVPRVENDINQSTGRLFRTPESSGVLGLFDSRSAKRFKYIIRNVFDIHRHGIKTKIIERDENGDKIDIKPFILNDNKWRN